MMKQMKWILKIPTDRGPMDGPAYVRPAGNGPKGETGTTVKYHKTRRDLKPEGL